MALTRSQVHSHQKSPEKAALLNPEDVSPENILGNDDDDDDSESKTAQQTLSIKPKKKVFTDDDLVDELATKPSLETATSVQEDDEEDSDSDDSGSDSDDAPEEESTSTAKQQAVRRQEEEKKRQLALQKAEKERRRVIDERNKLQKQQKKKNSEKTLGDAKNQELPEFLPEDIELFIKQSAPVVPTKPNRHIRLEDEDQDLDGAELESSMQRKRKLEQKLKELKNRKRISVKKGPVYVQTQTFGLARKVVPKAESKIVKNKAKWLNRKSINRK